MKYSVKAFQTILNYTEEKNTFQSYNEHALKLTKYLAKDSELLRTEIFCQLCKQTTANPDPESNLLGWELLALCVSFAAPGPNMQPYLMSHCINNLHTSEKVKIYAEKVMAQAARSFKLKPRSMQLTIAEVEATKILRNLTIRIYFVDGKYALLPVDILTTVSELETAIANKLGLKYPKPFSLFELSLMENDVEEERVLEKNERILEITAIWNMLYTKAREVEGKYGIFDYSFCINLIILI